MENNFVLSWKDITVSVVTNKSRFWRRKAEDKIILNGVSGEANNGCLVAIMGPSGAGKTTFLASIAGKISRNEGLLTINNKIVTNDEMKNISGYLHQHFIVTESLTAKEHLIFMHALKLNNKAEERRRIVSNLIFELNLECCMNTPIRNLSGGERKRLALAVELLGDPVILYCDEPTTGLDSFSASSVIEILSEKAVSGKLVIATIHQPSSQLYNYFDEIILLNKGKLIFQGNKKDTHDFFDSMDLKFPLLYNPADFYIQHINESNKDSVSLNQLECYSRNFGLIREKRSKYVKNGLHANLHIRKRKRRLFVELFWLIWRSSINTRRNMGYHAAHFGLLVVSAFLISAIYADIGEDDENGVQNFKGLLFFITTELIFTHLYGVIYAFPEEYNIFLREESLYSPYAYFISKIIALIPRCIVQPFIFLLIIFLQVQFSSGYLLLLKMTCVLFVGCIAATSFGLCISAIFQSLEAIELFIMPIDLLSMLLAGILVKIQTIPIYFRWIKYVSPFYYVYESLSILQWNSIGNLTCSNETSLPCYENGMEVLEDLGFATVNSEVLLNICGMCLLSVFLCFIGYLGILRKQKHLL